jgi:ribonucleoside-diphosphate reductase alpha chain
MEKLSLAQPVSEWVWNEKYRYKDETLEDTFRRVALAVAEAGEKEEDRILWYDRYYQVLSDFSFIPAGRIIAGAGTPRGVTLFNCYVMGTIEDSLEGIMHSLSEAAFTLKQGGGVGMDFSTLRPRGAYVASVEAASSGAVSFMQMWDSMCRTIESAGARRGAMMGTLHINHPDVLEFIEVKKKAGALTSFNISLLITDEFLSAVKSDHNWSFSFGGKTYGKSIPARELWQRIVETTYEYSEPGVIFIDRVNATNPLRNIEVISATNPCGEQPLPPYGACNLGSLNLTRFVIEPFTPKATFDYGRFASVAQTAVRFLDSIVEASNYPLEAQKIEALAKRRVGLGITGFADMLIMLSIPYSNGSYMADAICKTLRHEAEAASADLGRIKGPYPAWDASHGSRRRNSHLLSIAPTGTISLFAGNISSGIEPVFDFVAKRKLLRRDFTHDEVEVLDYARLIGHRAALGPHWQTAADLTIDDHLAIVAACQPHIDSGISKTINVPASTSLEDFRTVYTRAYSLGLKGCTTYRPSLLRGSVLTSESMRVEPVAGTNVVQFGEKFLRNPVLHGRTYKSKPAGAAHAFYVTINDIEVNGRLRPFELFINSKAIDGYPWIVALSRMVSAVFRKGGDVAFVAEELKSVFDPKGGVWQDGVYIPSVCAAVGRLIEQHFRDTGFVDLLEEKEEEGERYVACPRCAGTLRMVEGCWQCTDCTYSKC